MMAFRPKAFSTTTSTSPGIKWRTIMFGNAMRLAKAATLYIASYSMAARGAGYRRWCLWNTKLRIKSYFTGNDIYVRGHQKVGGASINPCAKTPHSPSRPCHGTQLVIRACSSDDLPTVCHLGPGPTATPYAPIYCQWLTSPGKNTPSTAFFAYRVNSSL